VRQAAGSARACIEALRRHPAVCEQAAGVEAITQQLARLQEGLKGRFAAAPGTTPASGQQGTSNAAPQLQTLAGPDADGSGSRGCRDSAPGELLCAADWADAAASAGLLDGSAGDGAPARWLSDADGHGGRAAAPAGFVAAKAAPLRPSRLATASGAEPLLSEDGAGAMACGAGSHDAAEPSPAAAAGCEVDGDASGEAVPAFSAAEAALPSPEGAPAAAAPESDIPDVDAAEGSSEAAAPGAAEVGRLLEAFAAGHAALQALRTSLPRAGGAAAPLDAASASEAASPGASPWRQPAQPGADAEEGASPQRAAPLEALLDDLAAQCGSLQKEMMALRRSALEGEGAGGRGHQGSAPLAAEEDGDGAGVDGGALGGGDSSFLSGGGDGGSSCARWGGSCGSAPPSPPPPRDADGAPRNLLSVFEGLPDSAAAAAARRGSPAGSVDRSGSHGFTRYDNPLAADAEGGHLEVAALIEVAPLMEAAPLIEVAPLMEVAPLEAALGGPEPEERGWDVGSASSEAGAEAEVGDERAAARLGPQAASESASPTRLAADAATARSELLASAGGAPPPADGEGAGPSDGGAGAAADADADGGAAAPFGLAELFDALAVVRARCEGAAGAAGAAARSLSGPELRAWVAAGRGAARAAEDVGAAVKAAVAALEAELELRKVKGGALGGRSCWCW
jgi:hypothetical protein